MDTIEITPDRREHYLEAAGLMCADCRDGRALHPPHEEPKFGIMLPWNNVWWHSSPSGARCGDCWAHEIHEALK